MAQVGEDTAALLGLLAAVSNRLEIVKTEASQLAAERDDLVKQARGRGASWSRIAAAASRSITRCVTIVGGG